MKIAILGTRGIPANYGGFETFAEELSARLAARGHDVVVYGRSNHIAYREPRFRGARVKYLPTIAHKYLDTVAHTFLSTLHALLTERRLDVILYCNAANAIFSFWPRVLRIRTVINVDGLERQRRKWNALGRAWYRLSEFLATFLPNGIVSDAEVIRAYYRAEYGRDSWFIPYGADTGADSGAGARRDERTTVLDQLGLQPQEYFLYVSRLEPENNALLVAQAFEQLATDKRLVIVGTAPYASEYIARLKSTRDARILFPGGIYGEGYRQLQAHAFAYVHSTEVGGTHPALIEAMGRGCATLYLNTPENAEVAGDAALAFAHSSEDCAAAMRRLLDDSALRSTLQARGRERVAARYNWDTVTSQYEELFRQLLDGRRGPA
jgi:glycosyltransferase involved in cell wall biosynthesis